MVPLHLSECPSFGRPHRLRSGGGAAHTWHGHPDLRVSGGTRTQCRGCPSQSPRPRLSWLPHPRPSPPGERVLKGPPANSSLQPASSSWGRQGAPDLHTGACLLCTGECTVYKSGASTPPHGVTWEGSSDTWLLATLGDRLEHRTQGSVFLKSTPVRPFQKTTAPCLHTAAHWRPPRFAASPSPAALQRPLLEAAVLHLQSVSQVFAAAGARALSRLPDAL